MKYKKIIGVSLLSIGLISCATAPARRLDYIPLQWKPTSEAKLPTGTLSEIIDTKVQFEKFKDVRNQPELIAENREDTTPKSVTTHDNVGEFVSTHFREVFDRMGLKTVDNGGDVVIAGEVRQFFVDETTTYKGHILLRLSVHNRSGKTLWTGVATGMATRFGHSYSAENYYEVFSDSIINAVTTLFQDTGFQAALARHAD